MRRTHMELKYGKLKDEIVNRFSNQDQELLNKYAEKFNIYSSSSFHPLTRPSKA